MTHHHHHIEGDSTDVMPCDRADHPKAQYVMGSVDWLRILEPCTDPDCERNEP